MKLLGFVFVVVVVLKARKLKPQQTEKITSLGDSKGSCSPRTTIKPHLYVLRICCLFDFVLFFSWELIPDAFTVNTNFHASC